VDALKLDRSVVGALESGGEARALAQSVLTLAASRGLEVVAEGIETLAQLRELRAQRCDKGQGFLFAAALEPAPAASLIAAGPTVALDA
jgi:EAL domain-containing protein (putative c-di-GMP-specific phosphodiesterase class I)